MSPRVAVAVAVAALAIGVALVVGFRRAALVPHAAAPVAPPVATTPEIVAPPTVPAIAPPQARPVVPSLDARRLASAQASVATALELLDGGRQEEFRATLMPELRSSLNQVNFEACRRWVRQRPVRPDWEMAEDASQDGHSVRRVSIFGKSLTGFHDVDGRWLADRLWCLPVGVP